MHLHIYLLTLKEIIKIIKLCYDRSNVLIPKGQLIAVVGSICSGKSSLLAAMLHEMEFLTGDIQISVSSISFEVLQFLQKPGHHPLMIYRYKKVSDD